MRAPGFPIALLGPTANGKTELSLRLAERLDGEIIYVDSRQAYRGMTIGTATPTEAELNRIRHHGVAFLAPGERYGAGSFARRARGWIDEIEGRGRRPLLVGGTGFFYRALTRPVFREPDLEPGRRRALAAWLEGHPPERLVAWARVVDPEFAARLPVLDPQRAMRALEIAFLTGRRLSWWQEHAGPEAEPIRAAAFVLVLDADEHRRRIRARAEAMLASGWAGEVEALLAAGHDRESIPFRTIGYRAIADWIRGEISRSTSPPVA